MRRLREAVGFRDLSKMAASATTASTQTKHDALPVLKQYREKDGKFYFKLTHDSDAVLIQSRGFDNPKDAGAWVARFKQEGAAALDASADVFALLDPRAADALDALKAAEDAKAQAKADS
jgi:tryptophanyl-tRNA synthetase